MCGWMMSLQVAVAAPIYNGGGPLEGLDATSGLAGIPNAEPRETITNILQAVLSYMALIAVAAVIVAGIYLIVGLGSDESKDKAKKIIQYTLTGLAIILFARIIVNLVTLYLADQIS